MWVLLLLEVSSAAFITETSDSTSKLTVTAIPETTAPETPVIAIDPTSQPTTQPVVMRTTEPATIEPNIPQASKPLQLTDNLGEDLALPGTPTVARLLTWPQNRA